MDQTVNVIYRELVKYYQEQVVELQEEKELLKQELSGFRLLSNNFKRQEETMQAEVKEAKLKVQLVNEEKVEQTKTYEKRFSQTVKEFVLVRK